MDEIEFLLDDKPMTLEFFESTNSVTIYLPDGTTRQTTLNGLEACDAIKTHIRSFYKNNKVTFA